MSDWKKRKQSKRNAEEAGLARWHRYEREKLAWVEAHPDATPAELRHAMNEIAKRLSV